MPRLMSVRLTEQAVINRTKTVEPLVRLAEIEVVSVRREPLNTITEDDVRAEGFGDWVDQFGAYATARFIGFFCGEMDCDWDTEVTRIEFRYLNGETADAH